MVVVVVVAAAVTVVTFVAVDKEVLVVADVELVVQKALPLAVVVYDVDLIVVSVILVIAVVAVFPLAANEYHLVPVYL